jgi:tripeptide aminopeptidase
METVRHDHVRIESFHPVVRRFLRYVRINTRSDPHSDATPSTDVQKELGRLLADELSAVGFPEVEMDACGYVHATIPAESSTSATRVGLLAHMDTAPDEPGTVTPYVHFNYDGRKITLPGNADVHLDPCERPDLLRHIGEDLITSDGTSLLGSDDKAGIAVLVQLAADLAADSSEPRPELRLCFTVDEEIGRGVDKLDLERFGADVAYTIDGGGLDALYTETFSAAEAVLDIQGINVHPGYAHGVMVNAVRILSECLSKLPPDEAPETTSGRAGYIHPHLIETSNPSHARASLILRDFTTEGLRRRKDFLASIVAWAQSAYPRAGISLEVQDQYRNMRTYIEATDPRVISFAHHAAARLDMTLEERLVRGGTDGARLSEMGIPTPNIFNGGHDFHSRFEWNTAQSLERSLLFVKALVRYWAGHG